MKVNFPHGLGDVCNFARTIPLYLRRNIPVEVQVDGDKKLPILAAGGTLVSDAEVVHPWNIQTDRVTTTFGSLDGFNGNKSGENLNYGGVLTALTSQQDLWAELKDSKPSVLRLISEEVKKEISDILGGMRYILWHSTGNTSRSRKSFPDDMHVDFLYSLLDCSDAHVIILDWDKRTNWTRNHRIHHSTELFPCLDLERLAALMSTAELFIGIDSGPLYFSQFTNVNSIMVSFENMHPCQYIIPHHNTLAVAYGKLFEKYNASKRFEFQVVDNQNIAVSVKRMLQHNRYTVGSRASDVHLQHLVLDKCRGRGGKGGLSAIYDRSYTFDRLFAEAKSRFTSPVIVETGCMRASEDWAGAGMSTALLGRYAQLTNGQLVSYDTSRDNVMFASQWCKQFGENVQVVTSTGADGIRTHEKIDILYLDSLDSGCEGHQECNLEEFQAAEKSLHAESLVLIDDTPDPNIGKGVKTIKYALDRGWRILVAGYQVLLCRN